jgi:hypothetical protein
MTRAACGLAPLRLVWTGSAQALVNLLWPETWWQRIFRPLILTRDTTQ